MQKDIMYDVGGNGNGLAFAPFKSTDSYKALYIYI